MTIIQIQDTGNYLTILSDTGRVFRLANRADSAWVEIPLPEFDTMEIPKKKVTETKPK